jgi:hypothetical protein
MFGWIPPKEQMEQITDWQIVAPEAGEQRLKVNKVTHRIEFQDETETEVTIVIKPKESV